MNIERNEKKKYTAFVRIKKGDFFEWKGEVYLKISDDNFGTSNAYNCTRDNVDTSFGFETEVKPLNAKVVIE